MNTVFTEYYEIVDVGLELIQAYFAEYDAVVEEQSAIAADFGAEECLVDFFGRVDSVAFRERPDQNWRILKDDFQGEMYVAVPRKNTKAGKELFAKMESAPPLPKDVDVKAALGWTRDMQVVEGYKHYRASFVRLTQPQNRYFLKLPRQVNDGWHPSSKLEQVTERVFLEAIAEHNRILDERNGMAVDF